MTRLFSGSVFLLLMTGILAGSNLPLGKIAAAAKVSAILWACIVSLGAAAILLPLQIGREGGFLPDRATLRYALFAGIISFVAGNLLVFLVIPHVGAGYAGLMFALSPIFTLAFSWLFRLRSTSRLGIAGVVIGFAGAAIVAVGRQSVDQEADLFWLGAALLIPVALAAGNVYRTLGWPPGGAPDVLAFWSHLFSALVFVILMLLVHGRLPLEPLAELPGTTALQFLVGGLTFPLFFRLQQVGGPVYLSQIGYIAAAVGLVAGTVFLGETYGWLTWAGAAVIGLGIAFTIRAQMSEIGQDTSPAEAPR